MSALAIVWVTRTVDVRALGPTHGTDLQHHQVPLPVGQLPCSASHQDLGRQVVETVAELLPLAVQLLHR